MQPKARPKREGKVTVTFAPILLPLYEVASEVTQKDTSIESPTLEESATRALADSDTTDETERQQMSLFEHRTELTVQHELKVE